MPKPGNYDPLKFEDSGHKTVSFPDDDASFRTMFKTMGATFFVLWVAGTIFSISSVCFVLWLAYKAVMHFTGG